MTRSAVTRGRVSFAEMQTAATNETKPRRDKRSNEEAPGIESNEGKRQELSPESLIESFIFIFVCLASLRLSHTTRASLLCTPVFHNLLQSSFCIIPAFLCCLSLLWPHF